MMHGNHPGTARAMDGWLLGSFATGRIAATSSWGAQSCHRARAGGAGNPVSVVSPSGEVIMLVPGSDSEGGEGSLVQVAEGKQLADLTAGQPLRPRSCSRSRSRRRRWGW